MELEETVESYRMHFADGPVGAWTTAWEFAPGPQTHWEFNANGTGSYTETSGMDPDRVTWFVWSAAGDCAIKIRETGHAERRPDSDVLDRIFADIEPDAGRVLAYDFRLWGDPRRPQVAMFTVPEHEVFKFYVSLDYLRRVELTS